MIHRPADHYSQAIGIHGFGRVGRALLRSTLERGGLPQVLAINDVCDDENLLYLLRHDSVLGVLRNTVTVDSGGWWIDGQFVHGHAESTIDDAPWRELGVSIVIDASGTSTREQCEQVLADGVDAVVLTLASNVADVAVVPGANDADLRLDRRRIVSASTCDGNAAALVLKALEPIGVRAGSLLTLHSSLGYQHVIDGPVSYAHQVLRIVLAINAQWHGVAAGPTPAHAPCAGDGLSAR